MKYQNVCCCRFKGLFLLSSQRLCSQINRNDDRRSNSFQDFHISLTAWSWPPSPLNGQYPLNNMEIFYRRPLNKFLLKFTIIGNLAQICPIIRPSLPKIVSKIAKFERIYHFSDLNYRNTSTDRVSTKN